LLDLLAYLDRKLWIKNKKLVKILLPQTLIWGEFQPLTVAGHNSSE